MSAVLVLKQYKLTKCKPRLNIKHTRPNRAVWTGPGSCAHGKRNFQCTA